MLEDVKYLGYTQVFNLNKYIHNWKECGQAKERQSYQAVKETIVTKPFIAALKSASCILFLLNLKTLLCDYVGQFSQQDNIMWDCIGQNIHIQEEILQLPIDIKAQASVHI